MANRIVDHPIDGKSVDWGTLRSIRILRLERRRKMGVCGRNRFLLQPGCCSCGVNLWQNLGQTVLWMEVKLVFSGALRSVLRV